MKLRLTAIKPETDDVRTFIFEPETPLQRQPGQYLHYKLPHTDTDDRGDERWFTISAAPFTDHIAITTRLVGDKGSSFKRALAALQPGDEIEANGPEGDFVVEDTVQKYVFLAGGIGITPFHAILTQLDHDGEQINVSLLYANRNDAYVFDDEFAAIATRHPEFKVHKITDPKHIEEADIRAVASDLSQPLFYVSGPKPMVEHYQEMLANMGVPEAHIKLDDFPGYKASA